MTAKTYPGKEVIVSFDAKRCIHSAECVRGAPEVFNPEAKPWIQPDAAGGEKIAQVIKRCPTGALTMRFADGRAAEAPDAKNTVTIGVNGPLYLRGQLTLHASDGTTSEMTRAALCRCGACANKPFCDGSHDQALFSDAGTCKAAPAEKPQAPQGAVAIKPGTDGPVMIEGWVEFRAADGSTFVSGDKLWLCRCGASKNKPFCDGSHKAIGFKS